MANLENPIERYDLKYVELRAKILSLINAVDSEIREILRTTIYSLEFAGNFNAVVSMQYSLVLRFLKVFYAQKNLGDPGADAWRSLLRASSGSEKEKVVGLNLLDEHIVELLNFNRWLSNQVDHAKITVTETDAILVLDRYMKALEWLYGKTGFQLATIYDQGQLKTFLQEIRSKGKGDGSPVSVNTEQAKSDRERIVGMISDAGLDRFKDRRDFLDRVRQVLHNRETRVVMVNGRSGIGKSFAIRRMIYESVESQERDSAAGVLEFESAVFVELREPGLCTPDYIVHCLYRTLAPRERADLEAVWNPRANISEGRFQEPTSLSEKLECLFHQEMSKHSCLIVLDMVERILDSEGNVLPQFADLQLFIDEFLRYNHQSRLVLVGQRALALNATQSALYREKQFREIPLNSGIPTKEAVALLREFDDDDSLGILGAEDALLERVVQDFHGIPRTLETLIGVLRNRKLLTFSKLMQDRTQYEGMCENPARELYNTLTPEERSVVQGLAVFGQPVPTEALCHMLSQLGVAELLESLTRNLVVKFDERGQFYLHDMDAKYTYAQMSQSGPNSAALLHAKAAEYLHTMWSLNDAWGSIDDLGNPLSEVTQLIHAGKHDAACELLNHLEDRCLGAWYYFALLASLRNQFEGNLREQSMQEENSGRLGNALVNLGRAVQGLPLLQRALGMATKRNDPRSICRWETAIGLANIELGEVPAGLLQLEQALKIAKETKETSQHATILGYLGDRYLSLGDSRAAACFREALRLSEKSKSSIGICSSKTGLGRVMLQKRSWDAAIDQFNEALSIARKNMFANYEELNLSSLGLAFSQKGDLEKAFSSFDSALEISRRTGDRRAEAANLYQIGNTYLNQAKYETAKEFFENSLEICYAIGSKSGQSTGFLGMSRLHGRLNESDKALEFGFKALSNSERMGNRRGSASAQAAIARAYQGKGLLSEARSSFKRALDFAREVKDPQAQALDLLGLAEVAASAGNLAESLQHNEEALTIATKMEDWRAMAASNIGLARAYGALYRTKDALTHNEIAYRQALRIEDKFRESQALLGMARCFGFMKETDRSRTHYAEALRLAQEMKEPNLIVQCLNGLGRTSLAAGKSSDALGEFRKAYDLAVKIGNRHAQGASLLGLGRASLDNRKAEVSVDYLKQARAIFQQTNDTQQEATCLSSLGEAYYALRQFEDAERCQLRNLEIIKPLGNSRKIGSTLSRLGQIYTRLCELAPTITEAAILASKAMDNFSESIDLARQDQDYGGEGRTLVRVANLYWRHFRNTQKAQLAIEQAIRAARQINPPTTELMWILRQAGELYADSGRADIAEERFREALEIAEGLGSTPDENQLLRRLLAIYTRNGDCVKMAEVKKRLFGNKNA